MIISFAGQTLELLPEKALIWKENKTLVISDLHLGKIAHFRKEGIALPVNGVMNNFERLDRLILKHNIWNIIFTGDLFHSEHNYEWDIFCEWRDKYHSVDMHIVKGNHDMLPDYCYSGLEVHESELLLGPFKFSHHPDDEVNPDVFNVAGHIHPVVRIFDRTGHGFRFPCFYFSGNNLIMPSFGYFTGGYQVEPGEKDQVIAVVKDKLMDVSSVFRQL